MNAVLLLVSTANPLSPVPPWGCTAVSVQEARVLLSLWYLQMDTMLASKCVAQICGFNEATQKQGRMELRFEWIRFRE